MKRPPLRVEVLPEHVQVTVEHELDFDELVDVIAWSMRKRAADKCKGLSRGQVHEILHKHLSDQGRKVRGRAAGAAEDPELVPDHILEFVEAQLGALYPELRDHPDREPPEDDAEEDGEDDVAQGEAAAPGDEAAGSAS